VAVVTENRGAREVWRVEESRTAGRRKEQAVKDEPLRGGSERRLEKPDMLENMIPTCS
jgi:hypothetical protein